VGIRPYSLDIALHDTCCSINKNNLSCLGVIPSINYYKQNFMLDNYDPLNEDNDSSYIHPFFVGLLEGDGTITVDKVSKNRLRVRIIISLLNKKENYNMLNIIKDKIGGRVVIEKKDKYVTWIAASKTDLAKVFAVLSEYPLITTRKICQLNYAKKCLLLNNGEKDSILNNWDQLKVNKYLLQSKLLENFNNNFVLPRYFSPWLSGFIEAEGHFKLAKRLSGSIHVSQFIIGQNFEKYILASILKYFKKENCKIAEIKTKLKEVTYYKIGIGGKEFRLSLKHHFELYPLLGHKKSQYEKWLIEHKNL
jgi:hypothetical protein